ncbi:MAG: hypothetical protein AVDCRST_MAG67-17 [uncultured Solirubrobacteraceae bacterium]|uniref:Uncharacterized protein n=1 Tax=uncultured Solirubrobacteraceae bacterium TaxID=1162706 RepID=A0A6J4RDB3_9ACTN|nr:MAG: hypothetical protein AVDCRST_MAG67-17 [uncultured Solirubrobacteraceae bacterium]
MAEPTPPSHRLAQLLQQQSDRNTLPALIGEVEALLGKRIPAGGIADRRKVQDVLAVSDAQSQYHHTSHRCWGTRLKAEMMQIAARVGARLDEDAWLVWQQQHQAAFLLPASLVLERLPQHIEMRMSDRETDLIFVSDDGTAGLTLGCTHWPTPTNTRWRPGAGSRSRSPADARLRHSSAQAQLRQRIKPGEARGPQFSRRP